jgi:hypothetical protein
MLEMETLNGGVVGLLSASTLYSQLHIVLPESKFHTTKGMMGPVHVITLLNLSILG